MSQSRKPAATASRGIISVLTGYMRRRHGAVGPILALALIPIIGCLGVASEASNWWLTQRSMQNAADSAALAAAIDSASNYSTNSGYATTVPANCTSTTSSTTSWYCQAKAVSAGYNYTDGSNNVTVTPVALTSGCPGSTTTCYKVTVSRKLPIYLLSVVGFTGDTTIGTNRAQTVKASAIADPAGPPLNFCMLTTHGDFGTNGAPSADLLKCNIFANGNANCNGHSLNLNKDYASGTASCPSPDINVPNSSPQCDPYGATSQTPGGTATSCPNSTNMSGSIPSNPGCTGSAINTASNGVGGSMAFPTANVITPAMVAALGAGNTTIKVCGNAALGASVTNNSGKGGKFVPSVAGCSGAANYTGSANVTIIVYNGALDLNGCTLENLGTGGMTVIFAPSTAVSTACPTTTFCIPTDSTGGGVLDIAAPTSGTFKGQAIIQSAYYTEASGDCTGSGNKAGPLDWCAAGNTPSMKIQGDVYMPNGIYEFAGAVGKFSGAGALNCVGIVAKSITVSGTAALFNNFTAGITSQCSAAGLSLPSIPGSHLFYQALVS